VALVDWLVNANDASKPTEDKSYLGDQASQRTDFILCELRLTVEKVRFYVFKAVEVVFANLKIVLKQRPPRLFDKACQ
jgi:hypothetical protein